MNKFFQEVSQNEYFQKLNLVGGHKIYHQEGSAYDHTLMVLGAMMILTDDPFMHRLAFLHDIGKVENISDNEGKSFEDWSYPHHSDRGALVSLPQIINKDNPDYGKYEWYIHHHIQTLFWKTPEGFERWCKDHPCPQGCSYQNLALLGVADLDGSVINPDPKYDQIREDNKKMREFLLGIARS